MQQDNYGKVAKFFHWSIALLIIINYALGLTLDSTNLYNFHKQTGLTILVLVIFRIIWRLITPYPKAVATLSKSEKLISNIVHIALYLLIIGIPMGGILLTQSHGYDLSLWGLIKLPAIIPAQTNEVSHLILQCHKWAAHTIIILASLHALAALKHHFLHKDNVLRRMLPFSSKK